MVIAGKTKTGQYFDSVTLMQIGKEIANLPEVLDAACVMGSKENKTILASSGLLIDDFVTASDTDLLISVKVKNQEILEKVFAQIDEVFASKLKRKSNDHDTFNPQSLQSAIKILPGANLALISIAGKYAGNEAMQALKNGLHVMLFSDNVSLETEITLKQYAASKNLLVMGPDCGTAIINGIPLAFANVVNSGNIGIVAASGTGLQELTTVISNHGAGISQAIGTGGRDVKKEVGGIMFLAALNALANDPNTKVIVLASKPPHASVTEKISAAAKHIKKPIVAIFLGASPQEVEKYGLHAASTFAEAALKAVSLSKGETFEKVQQLLSEEDADIDKLANVLAKKCGKKQKYLRGLFSGGTFCAEAQVILQDSIKDIYSNATLGSSLKLENSLKSEKNTVIDLGEDEFTVGRPHPMIDYSLRNRQILHEAENPEVAVILLDIVLGYGSNMDPAGELVPVITKASKKVLLVCSITGTDQDPQKRNKVASALESAGAIVMPTNAAACKLAAKTIINC